MYHSTKMLVATALLVLVFSTQGMASEWDLGTERISDQETQESSVAEVVLYLTEVLGWTHQAAYTYLSETWNAWIEAGYYRDAAPFAAVIMSLLTHTVHRQRARIYLNAYLQRLTGNTPAAAAAA